MLTDKNVRFNVELSKKEDMKHTPSPWNIYEHKNSLRNACQIRRLNALNQSEILANCFGDTKEEAEANAKLIAAAPELLEALQGLVNDVRNKPNDTRYATHIKIAEAAIKKATS